MNVYVLSTMFALCMWSSHGQMPFRPNPEGNGGNIQLHLPGPQQNSDFKMSGNLLRGGGSVNGGSLTGSWNFPGGGSSVSGTLGWQNGGGLLGGFQGSLGIGRGLSLTGGLSSGGSGGASGNFGLNILFPNDQKPKMAVQ